MWYYCVILKRKCKAKALFCSLIFILPVQYFTVFRQCGIFFNYYIIVLEYKFLVSFQHIILVDGNWTEWSTWTECSTSCGGGIMSKNRTCSDPEPQFNGLDCSGNNTEKDSCNENHCPSKSDFFLSLLLIYLSVHSHPLPNIFTSLILTMNIIFMQKKCI